MYRKDIDKAMRKGSTTIEEVKKQKENLDYVICALQDYKDGQNAVTIINALVTRFKNDLY